jgi:hypothetical protein
MPLLCWEEEATLLCKRWADSTNLEYLCYGVDHNGSFLAEAVGLTAAFSNVSQETSVAM